MADKKNNTLNEFLNIRPSKAVVFFAKNPSGVKVVRGLAAD